MKFCNFTTLKTFLPAAGVLLGLLSLNAAASDAADAAEDAVPELYKTITADYRARIPEGQAPLLYASFCPRDPEIQAAIDYYVIHNNRKRIYMDNIQEALKSQVRHADYVSNNPDMSVRSFPLVTWLYNSIIWAGEPMKFYYLVGGSWAAAPIFNITPDREAAPTGRLVMTFAMGDSYNLLDTGTPDYQSPGGCKEDNFCMARMGDFNPYRKIMMITREEGSCWAYVYHSSRADAEYTVANDIGRNEINFFAPHGNFVFNILHKDWASRDGKVSASITHDLSTLTIDGVKYKMIPGGGPWNKSVWYLKGKGPDHEKWFYMYPAGNPDRVYDQSTQLTAHAAGKLVFVVFNESTLDNGFSGSQRYILYPRVNPQNKNGAQNKTGPKNKKK